MGMMNTSYVTDATMLQKHESKIKSEALTFIGNNVQLMK